MHVRVLGAAAGGALPQWNCSCSNCRRLRQGKFSGQRRSQAQLAVSADGLSWYLLNASPDLRYQIESFPALHPQATTVRSSPIAGVVLLSAEVDAALGLLLLRESQHFSVYATEAVRRVLTEDNSLFQVLRRQPGQITWVDLKPGDPLSLGNSGMVLTPVETGGGYPGFVLSDRARMLPPGEAVLGAFLEHNGRRVAVFPGCSRVCPEWLDEFERCDAVFFDGTFWSEEELLHTQGTGKLAREMGHLPVQETMRALRGVTTRKIFIHINNTNPILDESSAEHRAVRDAGWEVAFDGMDLLL